VSVEVERFNVLGVGIGRLNMELALAAIRDWVASGSRVYVCVCPVHSVMECRRSEEVRRVFNAAGMVTPDGMPLVWAARLQGVPGVERVYGPDLLLAQLADSVAAGHRHYFYGGREGVAESLAAAMKERFPGLRVVGLETPPFGPLDELCTPDAAARINAAKPDVVWVGMSSPRQDLWMARMRGLLDAPVLVAIGAAYDFHTGTVRQAPRWMQRSGLEWLFRLLSEPRRLWRRYVYDNPRFLWEFGLQMLRLRRFELD
jgi:N-acetylglucosaminyldiphosphoundecaprenol N-acetyl-beta-D-mannosaminyltransferase